MSVIARSIISRRLPLSRPDQTDLFGDTAAAPEGFIYSNDVISVDAEAALIQEIKRLPFKPFEFQGYLGKRRIVSFGWKYDFDRKTLRESNPLPDFLMPLRATAAVFAGVVADDLQQVLINEYDVGAGVGWHRDKAMFEDVIGISLSSPATFRFRRERSDNWDRISRVLRPRSAYLMRGPSRWSWEHSVSPVSELRYSVTFRNFVARANNRATVRV
ncbi:MAG: alpha-ketoglutarate-dependent dioxygenase AlkB [Rhodospirillaceae bacterium]|nr:MAG: alpha-ketoglutarate-dependent dioxygenase AlkB [Rhodospirillaceae bacterium]